MGYTYTHISTENMNKRKKKERMMHPMKLRSMSVVNKSSQRINIYLCQLAYTHRHTHADEHTQN